MRLPTVAPSTRPIAVMALFILTLSVELAQSAQPASMLDAMLQPSKKADTRLRYGNDRHQFMDICLPKLPGTSEPRPVVLLFHGGCWWSQFTSDYMSSAARDLANDGYVAVNVEYRSIGSGGGWPTTFQDAGQAADHLRQIAGRYGMDLDRVVAVGHSAGASLVQWLSVRDNLRPDQELYAERPFKLTGVVALVGTPDFEVQMDNWPTQICRNAVKQVIGGRRATVPERFKQVSPADLLPLVVPQVAISGAEDRRARVDAMRGFAKIAHPKEMFEYVELPKTGHWDAVIVDRNQWRVVKGKIGGLFGEDVHQTVA